MKKLNLSNNKVILSEGFDKNMSEPLEAVWHFIESHEFRGSCHSTSALLYILLSEQGYDPKIFIGELSFPNYGIPFDHSWIEIDGKVIDLAIALPYIEKLDSDPIVMGRNVRTNKLSDLVYKSESKHPNFDLNSQRRKRQSIYDYLDDAPDELKIEFGKILSDVLPDVSKSELKEKYSKVYRTVK